MMKYPLRIIDRSDRVVNQIKMRLANDETSLSEAIQQRNLYFRMSVIGACNLKCEFCHNEGAPVSGIMRLDKAKELMVSAIKLGFSRIQFTGGEPLLHKEIHKLVKLGTLYFNDVGITTNGSYLCDKMESIKDAGINRIHISLQHEELLCTETKLWVVPKWLSKVLEYFNDTSVTLRLNLPIPLDKMELAASFLEDISRFDCDIKAFAILPNPNDNGTPYTVEDLADVVRSENHRRNLVGLQGLVGMRTFTKPNGIRCNSCEALSMCQEQSRSLRVGADLVLRPCLASRDWDIKLDETNIERSMLKASILAIDHYWSSQLVSEVNT